MFFSLIFVAGPDRHDSHDLEDTVGVDLEVFVQFYDTHCLDAEMELDENYEAGVDGDEAVAGRNWQCEAQVLSGHHAEDSGLLHCI